MFNINDDMSIYATRGDVVFFSVSAYEGEVAYTFQPGDVVRITVTDKKDCEAVCLQKDFPVEVATETVNIYLTEEDTRFGELISKPTDYWYEIELNPFNNPQTIIGYDEDGAKIFKLFPEGDDLEYEPSEEDIPVVDDELDITSERPVQNQAIARAMYGLIELVEMVQTETEDIKETIAGALESIELRGELEALNESIEALQTETETINSQMWALYEKTETEIICNGDTMKCYKHGNRVFANLFGISTYDLFTALGTLYSSHPWLTEVKTPVYVRNGDATYLGEIILGSGGTRATSVMATYGTMPNQSTMSQDYLVEGQFSYVTN